MRKPMESKMVICGVIHQIIKPLYGRIGADLAALRLLVETPDLKKL